MKVKDFKAKLKEENLKLDIEMSEKLNNTGIAINDKTIAYSGKKFSIFKLAICFTCFVFMALCVSSLFLQNKNEAVGLTSYILEINPSICITTDNKDKVINICALNDDANGVVTAQELKEFKNLGFDECLNRLMAVIRNQGYFENFNRDGRKIKLYAFNDSNEVQSKNLNHFENIMKNKMNEFGLNDVPFEKHRIGMDDFKEIVGFDEDYDTLDDMRDYFMQREVVFPQLPQ